MQASNPFLYALRVSVVYIFMMNSSASWASNFFKCTDAESEREYSVLQIFLEDSEDLKNLDDKGKIAQLLSPYFQAQGFFKPKSCHKIEMDDYLMEMYSITLIAMAKYVYEQHPKDNDNGSEWDEVMAKLRAPLIAPLPAIPETSDCIISGAAASTLLTMQFTVAWNFSPSDAKPDSNYIPNGMQKICGVANEPKQEEPVAD